MHYISAEYHYIAQYTLPQSPVEWCSFSDKRCKISEGPLSFKQTTPQDGVRECSTKAGPAKISDLRRGKGAAEVCVGPWKHEFYIAGPGVSMRA